MGTLQVVESGLSATDRVIVNGLERAVPGRKVTPREAPAGGQAKPAAQAG